MTLFEYVLRKYIGPPDGGRTWTCLNPNHPDHNPSMTIQSPTAEGKVRCKCYACGFFGDIYDILKILHPLESYPERQLRVRDLQRELTAIQGNDGSFSQGTPDTRNKARVDREAGLIWANFHDDERGLKMTPQFYQQCHDAEITVDDVIEYDREFHRTMEEMLQRHIKTCDDPLCGDECRIARGLRPLSQVKRRHMELELARVEAVRLAEITARVAHAMRNVKGAAGDE